MQVRKSATGYILRLDRGEEVMARLADFVREHEIPSGELRGIGAVCDTELGFFDLPSKTYQRTTFPPSMELVQLLGNISWTDDGPVVHAHAVLAGPDLVARGGHLFQATVSVTAEIYVTPGDQTVVRRPDPEVDLMLLDLDG